MQPNSVIALFCEDIRAERSGQETLVGIFPDNFRVPNVPGLLPKMAIYIRYHIDPNANGPISSWLLQPDGERLHLSTLEDKLFVDAQRQAKKNKSPFVGFITRVVTTPFEIKQTGRFVVIAKIGEEEIQCGQFNIEIAT